MILHVDMDAFYASVEERERPELRGQPIVVGGTAEGRGVVAAANYVVRKFGVHSAMPTATALRLCPKAIVIRPRMELYAAVSQQIREIFNRYTPTVEPLAFDEAFLDVVGCEALFGSPAEIGRRIKADIRNELRLIASVGVAPNKFIAKLAGDVDKPDGFVVVEPDGVQAFLDPLPIGRLWGVGRAAQRRFEGLGIQTIGQLRHVPIELLKEHFGKIGEHVWRLSNGIDERHVVPDRDAKSISHETTFVTDVTDVDVLKSCLMALTEQVGRRLRRQGLSGRTVQIKVRYDNFDTITRSRSLGEATNTTNEIWKAAADMLAMKLPRRALSIRLIGVGVSNIGPDGLKQASLFDEDRELDRSIDRISDQIKDRFGTSAIHRGATMDWRGNDDNRRR